MSLWSGGWAQPLASCAPKQQHNPDPDPDPACRDLPYAHDIKSILDRVRFCGQFAGGAALSAKHQPPQMQVEGCGELQWPLTDDQANKLKPLCQQAPHGRGEATVVDTTVRNTLQLNPDQFTIAQTSSWLTTLGKIVGRVQKELGVPGNVEAQLYKMLLYEEGSFFVRHRDTEKAPGMFGSLIVQLPGDHSGGDLVVSHGGISKTYGKARLGGGLSYVAFYADCTHEVKPVTRGHRLCLVYNLVLRPPPSGGGAAAAAPAPSVSAPLVAELCAAFTKWKAAECCAERLVYMFEHRYTKENSYGLDSLKGADKLRAKLVQVVAQKARGIGAAVVTVTMAECGEADVDEDDWSATEFDICDLMATHYTMEELFSVTGDDLYDDELIREPIGHEDGIDGDGPGEELLEYILQADPFGKVMGPDEEHCDGPTGNEGCPMDLWYEHAALLLWTTGEEEEEEEEEEGEEDEEEEQQEEGDVGS